MMIQTVLKNMLRTCAAGCLLSVVLHTAPIEAQTLSADAVISRYEANTVFNTSYMKAELTVTDTYGSSVTQFESWSRKNGDTLVVITEGIDKGQKILRSDASIYLYYPDAEEIIRLQGSALKDSIMGSDFSYEDLTGDNSIKNNYTAELLGTEKLDGNECYHVMLTAKNRRQTYQKQELWIDSELFYARKTIVYSASGKALREMTSSSVKKIGNHAIPTQSTMRDLLKKNSVTVMNIQTIEIDIPVPDSYFSREELSW